MPHTSTLIPINERQARELAKLPLDEQIEAWKLAVKKAPDGKITARHIRACVREVTAGVIQERTRKVREYNDPQKRMSPEFHAAYDALLKVVNKEILDNWKTSSRTAVLMHVGMLYNLVRDGIQVAEFEFTKPKPETEE